ncbi:hypothetical protein Tco_1510526 [Tanacetum coccineum]
MTSSQGLRFFFGLGFKYHQEQEDVSCKVQFAQGFLKFIKTPCIRVDANALIKEIGKLGKLSKEEVEMMIVDNELD